MRFVPFLCLFALPLSAQEQVPREIYIPDNPRAAAYILNRLSNDELVKAPRKEPVFIAWLERKGLDAKFREDALQALSALHKTDRLTELLAAIERLDQKNAEESAALADLGLLLLRIKASDPSARPTDTDKLKASLAAKRAALEKLTTAAQPLTRQIAFAALVIADGKLNAVWDTAARDEARLADLISAIPLLTDPQWRASFYPKLTPLLQKSTAPALLRAAITVLPSFRGHDAENFAALATLTREGVGRAAAVHALLQIPRDAWQKAQAAPLAQNLVDYAKSIPVADRSTAEFLDATQLAKELSMLLPPEDGKRIRVTIRDLGVNVIVIKTIREQMLFDKARIVVEVGKPVELILENNDAMPHNLVITAPNAREEIGKAADGMSPESDALGRQFIPASSKVLWATKLVPPDQRARLSFTAPTKPDEYPYVCTFPGHWVRMFGTMVVVEDVEKFLAEHPQSDAPQLTEWKLEDFAEELKNLGHRNFAAGKQLFTSLGCAQCHQFAGEGNAFGPPLAGVFKKWKSDREALLQQILEPSRIIEDKFRPILIETSDDENFSGLVAAEDNQSVTVQIGPSATQMKKINKTNITNRREGQLSLMPAGLLSTLSKDQIFDLLAYLESDGEAKNPIFHQHPQ